MRKAKGQQKGPDLIIEDVTNDKVESVMFVESEMERNQRGSAKYFNELLKRLKPYLDEYAKKDVRTFSLVVITNTPRRLTEYIKEHKYELSGRIRFNLIEGLTLFIVPALLAKEIMPAIFVRAMGAPSILAPSSTTKIKSY